MDDVRIRTKFRNASRRTIIESGSRGDQQIRFREREIRRLCRMHAEHGLMQRLHGLQVIGRRLLVGDGQIQLKGNGLQDGVRCQVGVGEINDLYRIGKFLGQHAA